MVADYNTMPRIFSECNKKYFNNSLPTPKFGLLNKTKILARFEYNKNKKGKYPIKRQVLFFSDCFDFDEKDFIEIMVHEMIHYYIAWNSIKDNGAHGKEFMKIANEINEKYGLNITKTKDASSFKTTENAPKSKSLFKFLFG